MTTITRTTVNGTELTLSNEDLTGVTQSGINFSVVALNSLGTYVITFDNGRSAQTQACAELDELWAERTERIRARVTASPEFIEEQCQARRESALYDVMDDGRPGSYGRPGPVAHNFGRPDTND